LSIIIKFNIVIICNYDFLNFRHVLGNIVHAKLPDWRPFFDLGEGLELAKIMFDNFPARFGHQI
jgi:hypothetical protein